MIIIIFYMFLFQNILYIYFKIYLFYRYHKQKFYIFFVNWKCNPILKSDPFLQFITLFLVIFISFLSIPFLITKCACFSWNGDKETFNLVTIARNAAPHSLCIALPVLQGRNYERDGQHAMSPLLSRPPTRDLCCFFSQGSYSEQISGYSTFYIGSLPRCTFCATTPKKFLLIVNTIFITESILIQMEKKNIWKRKYMLYLN